MVVCRRSARAAVSPLPSRVTSVANEGGKAASQEARSAGWLAFTESRPPPALIRLQTSRWVSRASPITTHPSRGTCSSTAWIATYSCLVPGLDACLRTATARWAKAATRRPPAPLTRGCPAAFCRRAPGRPPIRRRCRPATALAPSRGAATSGLLQTGCSGPLPDCARSAAPARPSRGRRPRPDRPPTGRSRTGSERPTASPRRPRGGC